MSSQHPPPPGEPPASQPPASQPPYGGGPPQYGSPPPGGHQPYPGAEQPQTDAKGFFGALFDFSFQSFVTPKIVKFVYVLATIVLVLTYVAVVIAGFAGDTPAFGILWLVLGWIPFLLYLALIRMTLEFYFSIVRMSQDIHLRLPG